MILIIALGVLTTALGVGFGWSVLELTMRMLERSLDQRQPRSIPSEILRTGPLA